ncbi:DUF4145 domain-containing protein [Methylobacterium fujisawaense]|uniref:DUF4145 domain-containing protein n=1 Tax=Methylobacterium fujisawaense TaxID=107400 RepID=UPI003CF79E67
MATLVHTCPFCRGKLALDIVSKVNTSTGMPALYLFCSSCQMPSIALVAPISPDFNTAVRIGGSQAINPTIGGIAQSFPGEQPAKAPDHVPPEAQRVFLQAVEAHRRASLDLAAMGFRRALELTLKAYDPELKGQLGPRIDQLASRRVLTADMKEWADDARVLGNDANHDPPEPTAENVQQLHLFTETLMELLFTLPKTVQLRRASKAADG